LRFNGLDLNLLRAFDVLMEECSVSCAADRLHLSQSATSAALMRLRSFFDDPILRAEGRRMHRTPFAESLWPKVRDCLNSAELVTAAAASPFDPATSRRVFRIVASDYAMMAMVADFTREILARAPGLAFDFSPPDRFALERLDRGDLDLFMAPEDRTVGDHAARLLFEDSHVLMGRDCHPVFQGAVTTQAMLAFRYAAVALGGQRALAFGDRHLAQCNVPREVSVTAASFAILPWLLIDSDLLAVMPRRLAVAMGRLLPIRHAPLPIEIPVMREMMLSHRSRASDDGLCWLQQELQLFARRSA
jgi:DNA-binding transcriptional LysR family regulator